MVEGLYGLQVTLKAVCIMYLHAVGWYHFGVATGNMKHVKGHIQG